MTRHLPLLALTVSLAAFGLGCLLVAALEAYAAMDRRRPV